MGVTICMECKFAERKSPGNPTPTGNCLNPDAPVSDYVHGLKYCGDINKYGDCGFFVPRNP